MAMLKYVQYGILSGEIYATVTSETAPIINPLLRLQQSYPEGTDTTNKKVNILTFILESL